MTRHIRVHDDGTTTERVERPPVTRCGLPVGDARCVRVLGHGDECRSTWHRTGRCGAPMARGGRCARRPGHRWEHRSLYAIQNGWRPEAVA